MMRPALLLGLLALPLAAQEGPAERRLVFLRSQHFQYFAESDPAFDFTCYLPRRFQIRGLESSLLKATSNASGLPSRLLGNFQADQVQVAPLSLSGGPPLLPLSLLARKPWRGVVDLRAGASQAALLPGQWEPCQLEGDALLADGRYRVTGWREGETLHLADPHPLPPPGPTPQLQGALIAVVGERFLEQSVELYRSAHTQQFRFDDPSGHARAELSHLGITSLPGHPQGFGRLSAQWKGVGSLVEGEWEAPLELKLQGGWVRLRWLAQGQRWRLVKPLFAEVPAAWSQALSGALERFFQDQWAVPVPGAYLQQLLDSGLVTTPELEQLRVASYSSGDRRRGGLIISLAERLEGEPQELSWVAPDGFALGISQASLQRSLSQFGKRGELPMRIAIPKGKMPTQRVLIFQLELKALELQHIELGYDQGRFRFQNCRLAVHWQLGPLKGLEPGALVSGWAEPGLDQGQLRLRLAIEELQFLSPQILKQSPAQQQRLRQQILQAVAGESLPLPLSSQMVTPLHPERPLKLRRLLTLPERLWLVGGW